MYLNFETGRELNSELRSSKTERKIMLSFSHKPYLQFQVLQQQWADLPSGPLFVARGTDEISPLQASPYKANC